MSVSAASESALRTTRAPTIAVRLCSLAGSSQPQIARTHAHRSQAHAFLRLRFEPWNGAALGSATLEPERWVVGDASAACCLVPAHDDAAVRAAARLYLSGVPAAMACRTPPRHPPPPPCCCASWYSYVHARAGAQRGAGLGPPAVAVIPTVHTPWIGRHRRRATPRR
jgi:hypothetical protein